MTSEPLPDLLRRLQTSADGLSRDDARRRLAQAGPNEPARRARWSTLTELLAFLTNPLVLILLAASGVSVAVGDRGNASIIVLMVLLSVVLSFVQTYRSQRAAERLREEVAPRATVRRDGRWTDLPRRELVPGDVIRLAAGDRVPADARLLDSRDLHVQQAALTGESMPAEKDARAAAEDERMVFLGTSVVSGTATGVVTATGAATAFGDIAARLSSRPPPTEFERGIARFALLIMRTVIFLVLFVLLASVLMHRPALESLLFAVALAVGLTPEFLPMITTVTLAQGAVRMSRQKVIVKHLAAIEDFGSMDVLCSDKTGTLTTGEMVLDRCLDPLGGPSDRVLAVAWLNSIHETGIRSPLDAAILARGPDSATTARKLDEIPFDFERRRLSVAVEDPAGTWLITKGAPEPILALCAAWEAGGEARTLDDAARARCRHTYEALSADGFRVLAVAQRRLTAPPPYAVTDERR